MKQDGFKIAEIPTIYYKNSSLEKAMDYLFIEVDRAIRDGANILILSDRGVDEYHVAMPSLLALSDCNSIWCAQRRELPLQSFLRPESQEKYIILRHYLDMEHAQSIHILHMRQSVSLLIQACCRKIITQQLMITITEY